HRRLLRVPRRRRVGSRPGQTPEARRLRQRRNPRPRRHDRDQRQRHRRGSHQGGDESADDVIQPWDRADPSAIHPLRRVSEDAYWDSGRAQASMLATVIPDAAKVMDFGCGDARGAIPMAALGFELTAADASRNMLDRLTDVTSDTGNAHDDLTLGITTVQA